MKRLTEEELAAEAAKHQPHAKKYYKTIETQACQKPIRVPNNYIDPVTGEEVNTNVIGIDPVTGNDILTDDEE